MYQEKYIENDDNIIRVCGMSIILLFFKDDIFFLYLSNEGCCTFVIHLVV